MSATSVEQVTKKTEDLSIDGNKKTVLNAASTADKEFELKHPLNTQWTLWYTKPKVDNTEDWSSLLRPVTKLSTVEEFWGVYQSIPKASELPLKSDYHLFRNDIRPEWEDDKNAKGGKWTFQINDSDRALLDELWLKVVLSAIGETLDENDVAINGVVFNMRKKVVKLAIWTNTCDKEVLTKIGLKFRAIIGAILNNKKSIESQTEEEKQGEKPEHQPIEFKLEFIKHADSENRKIPPFMIL
ncbi:related to Eukaryotic translation initiation factor 4E [Saccharomycodes ludwigii]|uniref:Related to Eukaryotic translation initiation factor 4E n=1 Tax=Saccharomycodes ludwigii TaxID=36035 RepID=A0A376BCX7_9ASCO|nr:hypothetical protein SCDLUD_004998 [Saccharomycodes ludwigii]KAH3898676.1 hypothetical protein SCDLUD_004998 [Saccharomycodes ludwigii]SSD61980.1 related to Eukaryotic translation initiation factor 4E [Saccharomycodes ludwigii]